MPKLLHVLCDTPEPWVTELIRQQQTTAPADTSVVVVDLTVPNPNYAALVEQVFAADSIATW